MKIKEKTTHSFSITTLGWKINSSDTNVHQKHYKLRHYGKKIHLPIVVCLMLLLCIYSIPMVSCRTILDKDNNDNNDDIQHQFQKKYSLLDGEHNEHILNENFNNNKNIIHPTQHNRKRKNSYNGIHSVDDDKWTLSDTINDRNGEQISKRIKDKIRRRLKNKNKYNRDKLNKNYDENSQKSQYTSIKNVENHDGDFKYIESDKKYFDYFPIEKIELNSNETEVDDNIKVIFLLNNDDHDDDDDKNDGIENKKQHRKKIKKFLENGKRISYNRSKRSVSLNPSEIDNPIYKRNIDSNVYRNNVFDIDNDSLVTRRMNSIFRRNQDETSGAEENRQYYSFGTINDPWNNRYVRPLNNYYVPVSNGRIQTTIPLIKYPIPGIYYNPISPPGNSQRSRRPSTDVNTPSIGTRFQDRVIWDVEYIGRPSVSTRPTQRPTTEAATRRTPPPLIRNPQRDAATQRPNVSTLPAQSDTNANRRGDGVGITSATTRRTPPPLIRNPQRVPVTPSPNVPLPAQSGSTSDDAIATTQLLFPPASRDTPRPQQSFNTSPPLRTTTRRPQPPSQTRRPEPSKCVWAIVSCCSRDNLTIRYSCFEQIGCHGAFWDLNPCADEIQEKALAEANRFFD